MAVSGNFGVILVHENNNMNTKTDTPFSMVLVTDTLFDTNGVSRFIQDMASHAHLHGVSLKVITASPVETAPLPPNIVKLKPFLATRMPFYKEQYLNIVPPLYTLYKSIRSNKPEIVHISTPGPLGWAAFFIASLLRVKKASTYHTDFPAILESNTGSPHVGRITTWVMRRFYRPMVFVFSRSKRFLPLLHDEIGIDVDKSFFLPSGTDTEKFHPCNARPKSFWKRYGIDETATVLLYVGRLNVEKNVLFMVERFKELRRQTRRHVALAVVGEGEYERFADSWLEDEIHVLGVKRGEELSQIYASSDIFLSASETETLGQTVMEAQASGVPAVVTDKGGVTETVVDQHTGYVLSVKAPGHWVSVLKRLVEDAALREQMGVAAHRRMQKASIQSSCEAFLRKHIEVARGIE